MRHAHSLSMAVKEVTRLQEARERAMLKAFEVLEQHECELAELLLQTLGDRVRAARWMCVHQRAFGGRSAYETLADGEVDRIWDRLLGDEGRDGSLSPVAARMVY